MNLSELHENLSLFDDPQLIDVDDAVAVTGGPAHPSRPSEAIGALIHRDHPLTEAQVQAVLAHQQAHKMRFGEAAVALGFASQADVIQALSHQFDYPHTFSSAEPLSPELVLASQPFSKQAEMFRSIRSALLMRVFAPGEAHRPLAVVSPNTGDGKTFFVANLGVALAQTGRRTLLIDCDMRGPRLHQPFGMSNDLGGLSGLLSGRQEDKAVRAVPGIPGLYLLPVGVTPPNPLELIERPAFKLLLKQLALRFDYVVVDTPNAAVGIDAVAVAAKCGNALGMARRNRSKANGMQDLLGKLASAQVTMAGVVFNEF